MDKLILKMRVDKILKRWGGSDNHDFHQFNSFSFDLSRVWSCLGWKQNSKGHGWKSWSHCSTKLFSYFFLNPTDVVANTNASVFAYVKEKDLSQIMTGILDRNQAF